MKRVRECKGKVDVKVIMKSVEKEWEKGLCFE
jgi:hypothetical protein